MRAEDNELLDTIPLMYEIVYCLMFKLYSRHRTTVKNKFGRELMPEVKIVDYLPRMKDFPLFCEIL